MPRIARFLTVLVAATALVVGTVAPVSVASASASSSTSVSSPRALADLTKTGVVKTSLVGFTPGNIISDAVFTDKSTMTEAQIQTFLNSKVSRCQSGYVCLRDLKAPTQKKSADAYCSGYAASSGETAARIIYKVAQSCNMNPQVLITMLQKEQGLVTHTWPSDWRYNAAMGQACPDTAPCDVAYAGFFAQVYGAARQMQIYLEGKWFQWYKAGQTWQIQYHPDRDRCGTGAVYIANKATEAMYYYTPYQPNASALAAGYGEGNSCASYGNRNFYNYFTDWFGSTQGTTAPIVTVPPLTDLNSTSYVVGADANGDVWGYPYLKSTWGSRVKLASGLGPLTGFFSIGDLDGDMNRDFIAVSANAKPRLLRGPGGLSLAAPIEFAGDWAGVTQVIPAGDFNDDGLPDVFTTNAKGELHLRAGDGRGGFAAAKLVGSGWSVMDTILGGMDFDGDGTIDLVARDAKGNLYLYSGTGKGSWGRAVQIGNGWSGMTSLFSPGDFNADGYADLLAHSTDGQLVLYKGVGGGRVSKVSVVGTGWQTMSAKASAGPVITAPPALHAGMGNLDGAAGNDVVAVSSSGDALIYGGTGNGTWTGSTRIDSGWGAGDSVIPLGDFDRSGTSDFGRIDAAGALYLYRGNIGGGVAAAAKIGQGWGGFSHVVGGVDFDGDRLTDILAVDASGSMYLYRGNGSGGFLAGRTQVGTGWDAASIFHAGDFDGDGKADIIARMADGSLRIYPTNGAGSWGKSVQIGRGWDSFAKVFSPGDFNGDGKNDVLAVTSTGLMYLYPGNGKGSWGVSRQIGRGWHTMSTMG